MKTTKHFEKIEDVATVISGFVCLFTDNFGTDWEEIEKPVFLRNFSNSCACGYNYTFIIRRNGFIGYVGINKEYNKKHLQEITRDEIRAAGNVERTETGYNLVITTK